MNAVDHPAALEKGGSQSLSTTEASKDMSDEFYPTWKKIFIVFVISEMAFTMAFSSTATFPATDEIAATFSSTTSVLNYINAGLQVTMGISSLIWVPISKFIGRKMSYDIAIFVLFITSIGTACSPNLEAYIVTRILGGLSGTYFLVAGQTMIADIFEPVQRGTATSFFQLGTNFGPAFGPFIGGIVVTFSHWRVIFWIQAGMAGLGLLTSFFFVPDIHQSDGDHGKTTFLSLQAIKIFNPWLVLRIMLYPNVLLVTVACGFLSWFQYTLLVSPRHLINPRFHLTSPLISGLFYLAPGMGFFAGALLGGKMSDQAVRKGIKVRQGLRVPEDRLKCALWAFFTILPVAILVYGWGLEYSLGGLSLPIVSAFFCGVGVQFAFNGLNTFCAEMIPEMRTEVVLTKYLVQYLFNAGATASVVAQIDGIGIGFTTTICVVLVAASGSIVLVLTRYNTAMQDWSERDRV